MFRVFEPVVSETGDTRCLAQALPFDRFVVTASTERVACWIDRRFHQRAQLYEPEDTQTSAPRPHMRVVNRSLTLEESDRPPARARSFRPFRRYGVDGASSLLELATVPPPSIISRVLRCQNNRHLPHTRASKLSFTLGESARHPARERAFRPFRLDGVNGASRLVEQATVPPPCFIL